MNPYIAMQVFIALLLVIYALILCRERKELAKGQQNVIQLVNARIIALVSL